MCPLYHYFLFYLSPVLSAYIYPFIIVFFCIYLLFEITFVLIHFLLILHFSPSFSSFYLSPVQLLLLHLSLVLFFSFPCIDPLSKCLPLYLSHVHVFIPCPIVYLCIISCTILPLYLSPAPFQHLRD